MLLLDRKAGEIVTIGDDVEVEIIKIGAEKVRLGIRAPSSVAVDRKEIKERKEMEHAAERRDLA